MRCVGFPVFLCTVGRKGFEGGFDDLHRLKHGESSSGESIMPRKILRDCQHSFDRGRLEVVVTLVVEIGESL